MPPLLQGWGRICFSLYRLERERERERERWEGERWTSMVYGPCLHKSMQCMYVCMYVCIGEAVKG